MGVQYRELVEDFVVMMLENIEDITGYHIEMAPGRISVDFQLRTVEHHDITLCGIVNEVAKFFSVDTSSIWGRDREAATARKISMYLAKKLGAQDSVVDIAKAFGRERATVYYAIRKIDSELQAGNGKLQSSIDQIIAHRM